MQTVDIVCRRIFHLTKTLSHLILDKNSNNKKTSSSPTPSEESFAYRSEFDLNTDDTNISKIRKRKRVKRDDEHGSQFKFEDFVGDENDKSEEEDVDSAEKLGTW